MAESKRLAAFRARASEDAQEEQTPVSPAPPENDETDPPSGEPAPPNLDEEEQDMTTETPLEEREDYKAGAAAATARMNAVFGHANAKGREAHAVRLLGRQALSAEDITAELEHFPVAAGALNEEQQREAAEAGGRAEMQEAMRAAGNANLGTGAEASTPPKVDRVAAILAAQRKATGRTSAPKE